MGTIDVDLNLIPEDAKNLGACARCHYVMENRQWKLTSDCPNCGMGRETLRFQGVVALQTMNEEDSYIYRLLRSKCDAEPQIPGVYAVVLLRRASIEEDD